MMYNIYQYHYNLVIFQRKYDLNSIIDMFTRELICMKLRMVIGESIAYT